MSASDGGTKSERKRPPVAVFIIVLSMGLMGLHRVMQHPQFESYRTVDVIQLVASGACLGAAFVGLLVTLLRPRA